MFMLVLNGIMKGLNGMRCSRYTIRRLIALEHRTLVIE